MGSIKLDAILTKAVRFARKGNYDAAIKTLEVQVNRYYGSFTYYYLLGVSYLYSNISGMALTYLRLAVEQRQKDTNALLGLAALYLNHGDTDKAVDLYLEIQSLDAANKTAKKALAIIKKHPSPEGISTWIDSGGLRSLFPPFPRAACSRSGVALGVFAGAAGIALALVIGFQTGLLQRPSDKDARDIPAGFDLTAEERAAPTQVPGADAGTDTGYRFTLTRNEVIEHYEEARRLFLQRRDDAARVTANRIVQSNASEPVKNRARLLISYMEEPGFDTLHDRFSLSDVIAQPFLYEDVHVIWRGMASNLDVQPNSTSFNLLVGYYDDRRIVEGIVRVDYGFAIPVNTESAVEVLGRVIPTGERAFRIHGIAINQAGMTGR